MDGLQRLAIEVCYANVASSRDICFLLNTTGFLSFLNLQFSDQVRFHNGPSEMPGKAIFCRPHT